MTDFAAPPTPDGTPSGEVKRSDFRATPPARRRGGFPKWVAVLLVIGGVAIVGGIVAAVALTVRNGNFAAADANATGRFHSVQVVSGMCLKELGDAAGNVVAVDCDDPHAAEAVSSYPFKGQEWPGDEEVARTALAYCTSQLAPGGPLAAAAEGRSWVAWVPSEGTWKGGDRLGLCIVSSDVPWTGKATDEQTAHAEA